MKIIPMQDYIVLKRAKAEEVTSGGIYIPTTAQEKSIEAEVVAVGPGKVLDTGVLIEPKLKVGDKVLITKWAGNEIKIDGEEHLFIREPEIFAVIE